MAKVHKKGWIYIYSEELKQEIAFSEKKNIVICEDGTAYTFDEIYQVVAQGKTIPLQVHLLKKCFRGRLYND